MARPRRGRLVTLVVVVVAVAVGGPWLYQASRVYFDAKKAGLLDDVQTEKYRASRENNLKAIREALMQAAESDGQFPEASKWMDTAMIRLKTSDITPDEAKDKLRIPGRSGGKTDFGYAFNDEMEGKDPSALKDKADTILVYESQQNVWNAHGDPKTDGRKGGKGVTVAGTIVELAR